MLLPCHLVYSYDLEFYMVSYKSIAIVYRWVRLLEIRSKKFIEQWTGNTLSFSGIGTTATREMKKS